MSEIAHAYYFFQLIELLFSFTKGELTIHPRVLYLNGCEIFWVMKIDTIVLINSAYGRLSKSLSPENKTKLWGNSLDEIVYLSSQK